ncbi:MAG: aspartate/glutamate racemase family protein, partial [Steroidobacteraceae bacterium]
YEELCHGRLTAAAREALGAIIQSLRGEGAEGVILGCTELGLLLGQDEPGIAVFDTARLHALAAVHAALGKTA